MLSPNEFVKKVLFEAMDNGLDMSINVQGVIGTITGGKARMSSSGEPIQLDTQYLFTFKDLFDYIQKAEVDENGITTFFLNAAGNPEKYRGYYWGAQIYSHKRQMNIYKSTTPDLSPMGQVAGDIVFIDDDLVQLIEVNDKGYADYDHPVTYGIGALMDHCEWIMALGTYGDVIRDVIYKVLYEALPHPEPAPQEMKPRTFEDLWKVLDHVTVPGVNKYTYGNKLQITRERDTMGNFHLLYNPKGDLDQDHFKQVGMLCFVRDANGMKTRIVKCDSDGKLVWDGRPYFVKGTTIVDPKPDQPLINDDAMWHLYLGADVGPDVREILSSIFRSYFPVE